MVAAAVEVDGEEDDGEEEEGGEENDSGSLACGRDSVESAGSDADAISTNPRAELKLTPHPA